jgi:anion-transporting  ArsA/GET3 family ATPase
MAPGVTYRSVEELLAAKEIVVACGPGGVGKTTTAAAVAATAAARHPGRVLVLTIDPAKRLADALGIRGLGNVARRVPDSAFAPAGVTPRGQLWAAMLDTKESWDALVRRHAPDKATETKILANPLYRNIAGRFAQGHEYIAMERLYELHSEGDYDLIVVDTPPTRNAIDFLDAPERMAEFFSSRLLRWLIIPYRSRLVSMASRPFYQVADRILGSQFLQDIADFFILFQTMYDGFVTRSKAVSRLLRDGTTTFMVVTTLELAPAREAGVFVEMLQERHLHLGLLVCNKVLPGYLRDPDATLAAEAMHGRAAELSVPIAPLLPASMRAPEQVARVLDEIGTSFANFQLVALREADLLAQMAASHDVSATVPYFDTDITDLAGVLRLGGVIFDSTGGEVAKQQASPTSPSPRRKSGRDSARARTERK